MDPPDCEVTVRVGEMTGGFEIFHTHDPETVVPFSSFLFFLSFFLIFFFFFTHNPHPPSTTSTDDSRH